uniref:FBD domain-containing protein n=1 Tax=Solanum lycopersicum TaxID=4081 RepID=A0A3Q7HSU3_SOLLC
MRSELLDYKLKLALKDAAKSSILSKDWRNKWVTRAQLDFLSELFTSFNNNQVVKIVILRVHQGPILKFTAPRLFLYPPNLTCYLDIYYWMFMSITLLFKYSQATNIIYLLIFFTFHKLRYLELDMCFFRPPPNFKELTKPVLASKWPLIESLRLTRCTEFDILEIDAANLKCFGFFGTLKSICLKNAPILRSVIVWLNSVIPFTCHPPEELELGGSSIEYLAMGGIPENLPIALNNKYNVDEVSSTGYVITSCAKLQEVTIECGVVGIAVEPVIQLLQAKSFSCGAVKLLQNVEMHYFIGFEMEIEFVKSILASAPVLKEIFNG